MQLQFGQFQRRQQEQQRHQGQESQRGGKTQAGKKEAPYQRAGHHARHAPGIIAGQRPHRFGPGGFEKEGVQRNPESVQTQPKAPKGHQVGKIILEMSQTPEAHGAQENGPPQEVKQRVAVAGHAQRKGHQQRIEAGRRIQDANLQAAEMQGVLHIYRQEKINAGH